MVVERCAELEAFLEQARRLGIFPKLVGHYPEAEEHVRQRGLVAVLAEQCETVLEELAGLRELTTALQEIALPGQHLSKRDLILGPDVQLCCARALKHRGRLREHH